MSRKYLLYGSSALSPECYFLTKTLFFLTDMRNNHMPQTSFRSRNPHSLPQASLCGFCLFTSWSEIKQALFLPQAHCLEAGDSSLARSSCVPPLTRSCSQLLKPVPCITWYTFSILLRRCPGHPLALLTAFGLQKLRPKQDLRNSSRQQMVCHKAAHE